MANTYSSIFYHIVFSTKNRQKWIDKEIENRVWSYIGGIARKHKCLALQIGGIEDRIHAPVLSPPILSPGQIAQFLKGESSKWIHEEFPHLQRFGRQDGYSAFSVSKSNVPRFVDYIKISVNIIRVGHLKMSMLICCGYMRLMLLMKNIFSAKSAVADATRI